MKSFEIMKKISEYKLAGIGIPINNNAKKLLSLNALHRGERAFILGNGPSLNECDLSLLKDEVTFAVNNIYLNYEKMGFYPTYYAVEDVLVAEDRAPQINAYHGPRAKFFGNYLRYCIQDAPDVVWLNVRVDNTNYTGFPNFSKNAARRVWSGGTVTYLCMQLAYYMGFDRVYLIGFDHSYKIPSDADVDLNRKEITSKSDDPNHFDPNYFGKGFRWHDPAVDKMEIAYRCAQEVFEAEGRKIMNATVGGQLTVFQRIKYEDLFTNSTYWKSVG
jgi:6-hydroxymethylpterin diphosphokinase MptE-like